jgi:serine/threonine protein kinase
MAPEQVLAPSEVDARADIWSLGVVLIELLTGRGVFEGLTIPEIYSLVLHGKLPLLRLLRADAPATLERVISKCLQRKPECRYQNVQDLMEALRLVAELDQQPAAPLHVQESSPRESERDTTSGALADGDVASLREIKPGIPPAGMLRRCLVLMVVLATLALLGFTSMLEWRPFDSGTRESLPSSAAEHPAAALWKNSLEGRHAGHSGAPKGLRD